MNILFIENKLRIDKLGILYLSAILKQNGHSVELLQDKVDDINSYLDNNKVDFILYSVMSGEHSWYLNKNKELKQKYNFKSIFGGPHFTFFSEQEKDNEFIDYIYFKDILKIEGLFTKKGIYPIVLNKITTIISAGIEKEKIKDHFI